MLKILVRSLREIEIGSSWQPFPARPNKSSTRLSQWSKPMISKILENFEIQFQLSKGIRTLTFLVYHKITTIVLLKQIR